LAVAPRAFTADVADPQAISRLVADVEERLGPIEILQNNAGRLVPGTALTQELREWETTWSVNVGSAMTRSRSWWNACEGGHRERHAQHDRTPRAP
jgi:NADP-dependent 3-hydroxy acid dehydrogenase YdfG